MNTESKALVQQLI